MPDTLAAPRAVTTGLDGRATLNYLAASDLLVAVRVTAESIGTHDFQLVEQPFQDVRNGQGATITIRLNKTSRLAGRVRNREGQPVANQAVEVWYKVGSVLQANRVEFKNGPPARPRMARSRPPTTSWSARRIGSWSAHRGWSRSCRTGSRSKTNRGSCSP